MHSSMLCGDKQRRFFQRARPRMLQNADTDHPQELEALHEQQEAMQAEIKQHDQTKVETFQSTPCGSAA